MKSQSINSPRRSARARGSLRGGRISGLAAMGAAMLLLCGCGAAKRVSSVAELHLAVGAAAPGGEIVIAAGSYRLRRPLRMNVPGVTLRGATATWCSPAAA